MRGNIDFTQGGITSQLILFSIPIILGELFQNLYNSVDSLVAGNFVGSHALAAVSICSTLSNLLVGFFTGMSAGASVVVSRAFGGGDHKELSSSIRVSFTFYHDAALCRNRHQDRGCFCTVKLLFLPSPFVFHKKCLLALFRIPQKA